jgi:SH3-like domain-containing protein
VEVIAEHEQWRRIRDSESTDGWVYHGRLSNRRTVIVRAGKGGKEAQEQRLYKDENENSGVVAKLQPGVIANIERCTKDWCKVGVEGYSGFIRKDAVWGVYADERIK